MTDTAIHPCQSLAEVRTEIDRIDRAMLALLAERGAYVKQAARFKQNPAEVPAPERVAQVLAGVRNRAAEFGADPEVAEATWRAMIGAFIEAELAEHRRLTTDG
jgi:isochorismate pyruvate lyase